ncbi:DUF6894 family protein [Microvirga massiliensis]|uniref:DUF6894 family protein n=1 Tax=Microvirga massiliensis TaxID=1033741 RepID=UPI00062BB170|nr:hypothetical protein [Microvirga massiliensis]
MVKRYYFHLVDGHDVIPDEVGIDVADLAQARIEAVQAIREVGQECAHAAAASGNWRIDVTDAFGAVAFQIDMSELAENS